MIFARLSATIRDFYHEMEFVAERALADVCPNWDRSLSSENDRTSVILEGNV